MNVKIIRIHKSEEQCLGIMTLYDDHNFPFYEVRTLELPDRDNKRRISCIPCGDYEVIKRYSEKYGDHFHILNVPDRDYILMHSANFVRQLLGCIAVGVAHSDIDGDGLRDVTESKNTLKDLNERLPDRFNLTIEDGQLA
ncbi:MAG: DUF5675 family protein [Candidatus Anammoxibacter sp.]